MKRLNVAAAGVMACAVLFAVTGCSTVPKKVNEELTGIKTRVDTLEQRVEGVEAKQSEASRAAAEQAVSDTSWKTPNTNYGTTSGGGKTDRIRDIQQALKSAGYYDGAVDGIKGKGTKRAIKEFQKANGLEADGVVGTKTWQLLRRYL